MKDRSVLRESRYPKVEGQERRRLPYLASAILILLALSCVVMGSLANWTQVALRPRWAQGYEGGEPLEGVLGPPGLSVQGQAIQALNMAPGDRATSDFTLENFGPEPMRVVVTAGLVSDNGLCEALLISLLLARQDSSREAEIIYYGPLTELHRKPDRGLTLSAEGGERLIWSIHLPFESGNDYQAVQCRVDFVFEGQQM